MNFLLRNKFEIAAVVYVLLVGLFWLQDPLAQHPQLDAKENLLWGAMIMDGMLPVEPIFRAMLYPFIIGILQQLVQTHLIAILLGVGLHIIASFLVQRITGYIWESNIAQKAAFFLYILNPVPIFFALQISDITLGMVLFLGSVVVLFSNKKDFTSTIACGALAGLACLVRPHFIPASVLLVVIPLIRDGFIPRSSLKTSFGIAFGLAVLLVCQGLFNLLHAGEFKILPWQGSYNLYAANRPGANGLYFKQLIDVSGTDYINPARAEAEELYRIQSGNLLPASIHTMNNHWRSKSLEMVIDDPLRIIKLLGFKAYAVLNSYEQYNNLTYSYHKQRIPFLMLNPISFGMILILSILGSYFLMGKSRFDLLSMVILILGYSVSLILYYASARFRLPLVPFLTILAGGVFSNWKVLKTSRHSQIVAGAICLLTGLITFSSFGNIHNKDTYIQDKLLLANANAEMGNDYDAAIIARSVLDEQPERREALRNYTISYFNLQLIKSDKVSQLGSWEEQRSLVLQNPPTDPLQDAILGIYQWKWNNRDEALRIWSSLKSEGNEGTSLSEACLYAVNEGSTTDLLTLALRDLLLNTK